MTYKERPGLFIQKELGATIITEQQADILRAIQAAIRGDGPRFIAVPAGHGLGKSWLMGRIAIWCGAAHTRSIVLTTAPTWRQVEDVLWREIRNSVADNNLPGVWHLTKAILPTGSELMGLSTDDPTKFQGYHAPFLSIILDEGPGIDAKIWEVILRGIAVSSHVVVIAIGNPVEPGGPFYNACRSKRWKSITLSCLDHPNVINRREIVPGAVSYEWCEQMVEEFCQPIETQAEIDHLEQLRRGILGSEHPPLNPWAHMVGGCLYWQGVYYRVSPVVQSRMLGEFPDEGDDTLIPMRSVVRAMERGAEVLRKIERLEAGEISPQEVPQWNPNAPCCVAMDVARFGPDSTVIGARRGRVVLPMQEYRKRRTTESAGLLLKAVRDYGAAYACIDQGAMGAGVVDMVSEAGISVFPIDFGAKPGTDYRDVLYLNKRAQMYWDLRCQLEKDAIDLPPDDILLGQLTSIRYSFDRRGHIVIESKEDMKRRGLPSPDRADTLAMLCDEAVSGDYDMTAFEGYVTAGSDKRHQAIEDLDDYADDDRELSAFLRERW